MNYRLIANYLGKLCLMLAPAFLPSVAWALYYGEWEALPAWGLVLGGTGIAGGVLALATRRHTDTLYQREALALVTGSWVVCGLIGALPFVFVGNMGVVDAVFESVSGFTTCGASILDDIESLPYSLLFWRSFTHWLGGIGIVVLYLVVLPTLGTGGKMMLYFETSSAPGLPLRLRLRDNVLTLLKLYVLLTVMQTIALLATGAMGLFDALCHTFGTLATGGYSTRQSSVGAYDSVSVEIVIIVFMIAGATSFALHDRLFKRQWREVLRDPEWRLFLAILGVAVLVCALNVQGFFGHSNLEEGGAQPDPRGFRHALRAAAFSVTSLMTNTGFATEDFDAWPHFSRMLLVLLMFLGGCAGSTTGGIKMARLIVLAKLLYLRLERSFRPHVVRAVRLRGGAIPEPVQFDATTFFLAYLITFGAGCLVMSAWGLPFDSAASAVAACMTCTGPGLGLVGASETYSIVPDGGLITLAVLMVLGRLELMTALALCVPGFWRPGR